MGMSTPSHYNAVDLEKYKTASPKYDWKVSKTVRLQPLKRTPAGEGELSPVGYKAEDVFKKITNSSPRYSYGKEKGGSFISSYEKGKAFVPSPASYNLDSAYKNITIGARRGYK